MMLVMMIAIMSIVIVLATAMATAMAAMEPVIVMALTEMIAIVMLLETSDQGQYLDSSTALSCRCLASRRSDCSQSSSEYSCWRHHCCSQSQPP